MVNELLWLSVTLDIAICRLSDPHCQAIQAIERSSVKHKKRLYAWCRVRFERVQACPVVTMLDICRHNFKHRKHRFAKYAMIWLSQSYTENVFTIHKVPLLPFVRIIHISQRGVKSTNISQSALCIS
jgi:hypothetical protein